MKEVHGAASASRPRDPGEEVSTTASASASSMPSSSSFNYPDAGGFVEHRLSSGWRLWERRRSREPSSAGSESRKSAADSAANAANKGESKQQQKQQFRGLDVAESSDSIRASVRAALRGGGVGKASRPAPADENRLFGAAASLGKGARREVQSQGEKEKKRALSPGPPQQLSHAPVLAATAAAAGASVPASSSASSAAVAAASAAAVSRSLDAALASVAAV